MGFWPIFDNFLDLLADAGPWFLGGAILGARRWKLLIFQPPGFCAGSAHGELQYSTPRSPAPLCQAAQSTTVPLAAALKKQGARLGTLTAFIMISPILSPETITLTAAMLGWQFTCQLRIVIPPIATLLMGLMLNALEAHGVSGFRLPGGELKTSTLKSDCCTEDERPAGKANFWRSFVALLPSTLALFHYRITGRGNLADHCFASINREIFAWRVCRLRFGSCRRNSDDRVVRERKCRSLTV